MAFGKIRTPASNLFDGLPGDSIVIMPIRTCLATVLLLSSASTPHLVHVPRGKPITVDGKAAPGEWQDAQTVDIAVRSDWHIPVRIKHDDKNIYFLFDRVASGEQRLFPEIVIDPQNRKGEQWEKGQWWLHVSYNLCEGDGAPNVYRKAGIFQCAHKKSGWEANNPPRKDTRDIEIRVSFSKLKMSPTSAQHFGLALAVTDATGDPNQKWFFWPSTADVFKPNTWGVAVLEHR